MSTKHVQKGFAISVTLGATYASNDLIAVGTLCGVCLGAGDSGDSVEVAIDEVFEVGINRAVALLEVNAAAVLLLDAVQNRLNFAAGQGFRSTAVEAASPAEVAGAAGMVPAAAGTGRPTKSLLLGLPSGRCNRGCVITLKRARRIAAQSR